MSFKSSELKIATVIRGQAPASCISYHESGSHLYVSSELDSRLRIIDCLQGTSKPTLRFETDGIKLVQSTHHNLSILYTGASKDKTQNIGQRNAINYLSLHDNKILRQFRGHSGEVINISMSPVNDHFLSSSKDRTVRLWDLQQAGSLALMDPPKSGNGIAIDANGTPLTVFDSTGLVFGISVPLDANAGQLIHLYDARQYGGGAFAEMKVERSKLLSAIQNKVPSSQVASQLCDSQWKRMQFTKSGKQILVTTNSGLIIMVDGYDGSITNVFVSDGSNGAPRKTAAPACFSEDDKTVFCGNEDGTISCLDASTGVLMKKLDGHVGSVNCIATNPKYQQIASTCTNTAIWNIP